MKKILFCLFSFILAVLVFPTIGRADTLTQRANGTVPNERISWHEGSRQRHAVMSLNEVAIFPHRGAATQVIDDDILTRAFHPLSRITGRTDSLIRLQNPLPLTREDLLEKVRMLREISSVREASPVFYVSPDRTPSSLRIPTGKLIVRFADDTAPEEITALEKQYGIEQTGAYSFDKRVRVYRAPDSSGAVDVANRLYLDGTVRYAYPCFYRLRALKATPNDPLFEDQWHLENTGALGGIAGNDVNILPVWDDYRGSADEVIAIVDDGLETDHEDLTANILPGRSYDFVSDDGDPTAGDHGTSCAGVAAGRGFNGIGITGAAPGAGLVGYRIMDDFGFIDTADEAAALSREPYLVDIYSNSWGPTDPVSLPEAMLPATEEAIIKGVTQGRNGLGNIYVWANGNGREDNDNSNYDGYANSRYTIAVAASTDDGTQASYSEKGAAILVNAPSNGGTAEITTTDRSGRLGYNQTFFRHPLDYTDRDYTMTFGGTSAAAPLVAGVIALMLEANPALTWRDVQHILITTAEKNDPLDDDWTTNSAGFPVNHTYGFGRIDARTAVDTALTWVTVGEEVMAEKSSAPDLSIPDDSSEGLQDIITIDDDLVVEFVEVDFSAGDHPCWADLEIVLTSPGGTESILAERHPGHSYYGSGYENWKFGSLRHFGEGAQGDWTLAVKDLAAEDEGTFQSWTLRIYGTADIHTVTATAGGNGAITPAGTVIVGHGSSQTFQITPDGGYCIESVVVDGKLEGTPPTYTFTNITHDHTIGAFFAACHTITATAVSGGTIAPSGAVTVVEGEDRTFFISPNSGYLIDVVDVDGSPVGDVSTYTFSDVQKDHGISATFRKKPFVTYTITASAGTGGTISPSGETTVIRGRDMTVTIAPLSGFRIQDVLVDGRPVGTPPSYTFTDVTSDHTVTAVFEPQPVTYSITASAGTGGSISPSGTIVLEEGAGQTFTLTADAGYHASDLIVDSVSSGPADSYSFIDIAADHTIEALFEEDAQVFTITATAGEGGGISPEGTVTVGEEADQSFTATPGEGYHIADIFVDGTPVGMQVSYTFYGVTADHTIEALFEEESTPDGCGGGGCFIGAVERN